jgi:hypothetical protein
MTTVCPTTMFDAVTQSCGGPSLTGASRPRREKGERRKEKGDRSKHGRTTDREPTALECDRMGRGDMIRAKRLRGGVGW